MLRSLARMFGGDSAGNEGNPRRRARICCFPAPPLANAEWLCASAWAPRTRVSSADAHREHAACVDPTQAFSQLTSYANSVH